MPSDDAPDALASAARRLNANRARVLAGEEVSPAEYKELLAELRSVRLAAAQSEFRRPRATSRKSATVDPSALDSI